MSRRRRRPPCAAIARRGARARNAAGLRPAAHAAGPARTQLLQRGTARTPSASCLSENHSMERRQLANGVELSRIILGCGNFGGIGSAPEFFGQGESDDEAFAIMDAAWEFGITTFDTADAYGGGRSETAIGRWIASRGVRPEIATKTFHPMEAD